MPHKDALSEKHTLQTGTKNAEKNSKLWNGRVTRAIEKTLGGGGYSFGIKIGPIITPSKSDGMRY